MDFTTANRTRTQAADTVRCCPPSATQQSHVSDALKNTSPDGDVRVLPRGKMGKGGDPVVGTRGNPRCVSAATRSVVRHKYNCLYDEQAQM